VRLYRYLPRDGRTPRLAVGEDGAVVDLVEAWTRVRGADAKLFRPLLLSASLLISEGPWAWRQVGELAGAASALEEAQVDLSSVRLLPPLAPASLRDFLAFEDHVKRGAERRGTDVPRYWYEAPVYYKGNPRALVGPDDQCPWPPYTDHLDFELELAMIVGRPGRDVSIDDAGDHIFGFTILDDFSARDVQAKEMSAWLGPAKSKDFANALGPCIVTVDEIGPEPDLAMTCRVNGEEWGRARSSDMYWRWAEIVAHVSASEEIVPGDVYGSGTPGGCCGLDLGRQLRPGDVIELEIEKIGVL
jgi:2-keto-4-pentenoate hydratase/2-oxohepta-3-ene-1,7-dioic acid hydratase in catechol pathway